MKTPVTICNSVLVRLGQPVINSLSDINVRARRCSAVYPFLKEEVLRSAPWKCASLRDSLLPMANPRMGLTAYPMPGNMARIMRVWYGEYTRDRSYDPRCTREGNSILIEGESNSSVNIQYVNKDASESLFDGLLTEALILKIAAELAYSFVSSASLAQEYKEKYLRSLSYAKAAQNQETRDIMTDSREMFDDFIDARFGGGNDIRNQVTAVVSRYKTVQEQIAESNPGQS